MGFMTVSYTVYRFCIKEMAVSNSGCYSADCGCLYAFVRLCCPLVDNISNKRIRIYWAVVPLLATKDLWC